MKRSLRNALMAILLGGLLFAASCGELFVRSVKYGVYSYVGGSVLNTSGTQVGSLFNNVLTGGLFVRPNSNSAT